MSNLNIHTYFSLRRQKVRYGRIPPFAYELKIFVATLKSYRLKKVERYAKNLAAFYVVLLDCVFSFFSAFLMLRKEFVEFLCHVFFAFAT